MLKILVVDDSPAALEVSGMILGEAGYDVYACRHGKEALEWLKREPFDLVVTDIYMPDVDGLELIVEEHRARPKIPIVAVSGFTGPRNMLPIAKSLGACQTVHKPFSRADLLDAVEAALRGSRPDPEISGVATSPASADTRSTRSETGSPAGNSGCK